jgi:AcrR family transcriptional regulator
VTLRDIAGAVGMRHASLYYYVPGGKEDLFVAVMAHNLHRHHAGLAAAIAAAAPDLRSRLNAAAAWLIAQPPVDLIRLIHADLPLLDAKNARYLANLAYTELTAPLQAALEWAHAAGEIGHQDFPLVAGGIVNLIESLHAIPDYALPDPLGARRALAASLIDVLLNGLRPR